LAACGGGGAEPTVAGPGDLLTPPPVSTGGGATTSPPPTTPAGMRLVWSDEFDTPGLPDATKWVHDTGRNRDGWYNNELQYYASNRAENARIENGRLLITARQERLSSAPDFGGQNYTSARLITRGLASWTYGYYEVRAKLPCGLGTWPAIWMLGTGGRWPDDGEIDIMEQKGTSAADKREVLGTLHTRAYNWSGGTLGVARGSATPLPNACTSFNNYQMSWDADRIAIGVNGTNYYEFQNPKNGDQTQWPFDAPQFMILNLAIGGDLGGAVDNAALPAVMEVEYVRVYQR
jgi:beta-glucanase (GH16 family)